MECNRMETLNTDRVHAADFNLASFPEGEECSSLDGNKNILMRVSLRISHIRPFMPAIAQISRLLLVKDPPSDPASRNLRGFILWGSDG